MRKTARFKLFRIVTALVAILMLISACMSVSSAASPVNLFGTVVPANPSESDSASVEVSMHFTVNAAGQVNGVRFYKSTANTGAHVGYLYRGTTRIGTVNFTGETASGWQSANFATPLDVVAGQAYTVSYKAPAGHYADDLNYAWPKTANGITGTGSAYRYCTTNCGVYPTQTWQGSNYYVDLLFTPTPPPTTTTTTTPPTTTTTTTTTTPTTTTSPPPGGCDRTATPSTFAATVSAATAGQTVCLAAGSYGTFSGTNKAITIRSETGQTASMAVVLDGNDNSFTLASLTITSGGVTNGAHDITIRDSNFTGPIKFQVQNSNIVMDHNTHLNITGAQADGRIRTMMANGQSVPSGVTIKNSLLEGGNSDGIQTSVAVTIVGNEFLNICSSEIPGDNHTDNIQFLGYATDTVIKNNWMHQTNGCATQWLAGYDSVKHVTITDNVIDVDSRAEGIDLFTDDSSVVAHNTVTGTGPCWNGSPCGIIESVYGGVGTVINDNIAARIYVSADSTLGQRKNNMVRENAVGSDFFGVPVFVGGADPTSWAGYCLTATSPGKGRASDGLDVGIRC